MQEEGKESFCNRGVLERLEGQDSGDMSEKFTWDAKVKMALKNSIIKIYNILM